MTDDILLEIINKYNFTFSQITSSRREISSFCAFVTAKTKQACFHKDILDQLYRLQREGLIS